MHYQIFFGIIRQRPRMQFLWKTAGKSIGLAIAGACGNRPGIANVDYEILTRQFSQGPRTHVRSRRLHQRMHAQTPRRGRHGSHRKRAQKEHQTET